MTETPEELRFVDEALAAADSGSAGSWPTVAGYLADEVRRLRALHAEPTFTASELKERLETATTVALALGRKEAGEEIIQALMALSDNAPTKAKQAALNVATRKAEQVARRLAEVGPNATHAAHRAVSNALTAAPASPSTPEESKPAESAFPDLPEGSDQ